MTDSAKSVEGLFGDNIEPGIIVNLKKSDFTQMLLKANGLDPDAFQRWAFYPGMLYGSPDKWWGDYGKRDFPHEGIDLCLYINPSGRLIHLDEKTRIPSMHDGIVMALFTDFLGQAVIMRHEDTGPGNDTYLSVYAHTKPLEGIKPGAAVKAGDIIATIADTSRSKARILPHLHLTIGRPAPGFIYEPFVWNHMRDPDRVALLDPMALLDRDYQLLDHQKHPQAEN